MSGSRAEIDRIACLAQRAGVNALLALVLVAAGATGADAQLGASHVSPDIPENFGGTDVDDRDVAGDDLAGNVTVIDLGDLPPGANVDAYDRDSNGDQLFSLDIAVALPGVGTVGHEDVVRLSGGVYTLEMDGSAEGIPPGIGVDALSMSSSGMLLSFDGTLMLDGALIEDEDVVHRASPSGTFTKLVDLSTFAVAPGLDLDAIHYSEGDDRMFISFDGAGTLVGGAKFDDEDVLQRDFPSGSWAVSYDASNEHAAWIPADLDALHGQLAAECGDGIVDSSTTHEECDDGNAINGDCCSSTCTLASEGAPCDDDDPCTQGGKCTDSGECLNAVSVTCTGGGTCKAALCGAEAGCVVVDAGNDSGCPDGDLCNGDETCQAGICTAGPPLVCDDDDVCTGIEICKPLGGCGSGAPLDCSDGNACTDDVCDATLGCLTPVPNSDPCNDGVFCNGNDTCSGGSCSLHAGDPCVGMGEICDEIGNECMSVCVPGDCNDNGGLDAGDPVCTVLCLIDDPPAMADCACAADCNCTSGGVDAGDPVCTVLRLIDDLPVDPCE